MKTTQDLRQSSAWAGVWTALVTPLREDLSLDEKSLESLIENQIAQGVRGLVIAGSTGEGSLLPAATRDRLFQVARSLTREKIPVVAGLGIGGTDQAVHQAELARAAGFDGVLAAPPAYIRAPQRGLIAHFLRVAESGLPVCLYEIPGRAASSIEISTIMELVGRREPAAERIVAIKDASGDLARPIGLRRQLGARLALLTGDDPTYADFLAAGGDGTISVLSHFALPAMKEILAWVKGGDVERARAAQTKLLPFIHALFRESNPIPTKSLLAAQRKIQSAVFCPPLCPMKAEWLEDLQKLSEDCA